MTPAFRPRIAAFLLLLPLAACMRTNGGDVSGKEINPLGGRAGGIDLASRVAPGQQDDTVPRRYMEKGLERLQAGELEKASDLFNKALKLAPESANLHLLNGLTYHLMDKRGNKTKAALAARGYRQALAFNPDNWIAAYYLGHLKLEQRKFRKAQQWFAEALLYRPDDPGILYNMVVASYYAGDPGTAAGVLDHLKRFEPDSRRVLRADAMVRAALGRRDAARESLKAFADKAPAVTVKRVKHRLKQWNSFLEWQEKQDGGAAESTTTSDGAGKAAGAAGTASGRAASRVRGPSAATMPDTSGGGGKPANDMVIVDVVIIRTEEDVRTSRGVNLLENLKIQFGGPQMDNRDQNVFPAYQRRTTNNNAPGRTIIQTLTVPSLSYSLNIANATTTRNEILARPTLVARSGEMSRFFSGTQIDAAATSGGDGDSVQIEKEVGVGLRVQPKLRADDMVELDVKAERTFLKAPSRSIDFTFKLETSKTLVNADVVMNYGNTLVLSGLSEKETERGRNGVPFLQDIPGVQYFFSELSTRNFQKSVLILLTPRRPAYVYKQGRTAGATGDGRAGARSDNAVAELKARYADWFRPYPNWASIFHHMQSNQLYREFRTGDVTLEQWSNMTKLENRVIQAMHFFHW